MKLINRKKFIIFCSGIIFLILFLIGIAFFAYYQIKTPLIQEGQETLFIIEKGQGLKEIAANLEEVELIRSKNWFMTYIFYRGWAAQLQAGEYLLNPSWNISQIAQKIVKGEIISFEVLITIPEGFTLKQIDARLAKAGLIKSGELASKTELEGYLFPDTYQFNKDTELEEIIEIMRENFNTKLDEELKQEIVKQGKTIDQIIIMASLLEKEVPLYEDRQIAAGIFWKRIATNYPLQSCATIAYVLEIDKWIYSIEDTEINSPYNTYQNIGLPPGPISNPGLSAIRAAVYYKTSDYNFFLSKPDGETVFSKDFEEHKENKAKYLN
ncbi:MAG: endolytic transglycosylase MltG [Candidatus Portnoybacteria bacterium]|nr:endolytic transglycosylase MltG [Candidatus Portnoybacteria bacterium]